MVRRTVSKDPGWGRLLPEYTDAEGRHRTVPSATLRALERAREDRSPGAVLGRASDPPAGTAAWPPLIRRARVGRRTAVRFPARWQGRSLQRISIRLDGRRRWQSAGPVVGGVLAGTDRFPVGCHPLRLDYEGHLREGLLIVGPGRLARTIGERNGGWGIFAPVYALRDGHTWGCGDLSSLEALGRWAGAHGAAFVATLPLFSAFLDPPAEPSPYRPVSRRFWNEIYLDVTRPPEFRRTPGLADLVRSPAFRREVTALERRELVDVPAVARCKRRVLERMREAFSRAPPGRRAAFRRFVERTEGLREYAQFRAAREGSGRRGAEYHAFAQWLVDEQLRGVARRLRRHGVVLGLDLPLGVHPHGFDAAWDAGLFVARARVGSPPDPSVRAGQDWGFPPWDPDRMRAAAYGPLRQALDRAFEVAGLLRIDHVLGLHRLFWIPRGSPPRDGAYVVYPKRELYEVLAASAARAHAAVLGEDLGTVPPDLRPELARRGFLSLYVAELEWDGPGPVRPIPREAVAMLSTHDHLPFAGFWAARTRTARPRSDGGPFPSRGTPARTAFRTTLLRVGRSRARWVLVTVDDLFGETEPQNVPGRRGPYFRRRYRGSLAELRRDPWVAKCLTTLDAVRRRRYD